MEYQKITNLLRNLTDKVPKFITKNWIEVNDRSDNEDNRYKPSKQIRFKKSILQSDLCDYSDGYIVVKGIISFTRPNNDAYDKKLAFRNYAPLISCISKINNTCISKINNTLIDNAERFRYCNAYIQFP